MLAGKFKIKGSISLRLIMAIVGFSTLIAVFTSAVQLYFDYRRDINLVRSGFAYVEVVSLRPLTTNLWNLAEENLQQQLDSLVNHPGIDYAAISVEDKIAWVSGAKPKGDLITAEYPLLYERRNVKQELGRLHIVAGLSAIYQQLVDKALVILGTNFLKTLVVGTFMYVLFHIFFTRHLVMLADYARNIDLKDIAKPLRFQKTPIEGEGRDEFTDIADAINQMQIKLKKSHDELEHRVEERTKELRYSESRLLGVMDTAVDGIITIDDRGVVNSFNSAAEAIFGYTVEEVVGKNIKMLMPETDARRHDEYINDYVGGGEANIIGIGREVIGQRKDGSTFSMDLSVSELCIEDRIVFTGIVRDITERKQAEDQIKASLEEKKVLIQEIHHRVKNNLAVVSSLLSMQARSETNDQAVQALKESEQRVLVMARIHEALHQSDDLASINAKDYLNTLLEDLKASSGSTAMGISYNLEVDDMIFDADCAIPCGQVVSEMIFNCHKHAFPNGQSGNIGVSLLRKDDGMIELAIADDGKGLPKGFDPEQSNTLGMRLIHALASQLKGVIEIDGTSGTRVQITFPEKLG